MFEVKDLSVSYGEIKAVRDVSFSVKDHEIVSLIGSNGAGKSTALRTISGILKGKKGSVKFDGKELLGFSPTKIVSLGVVQVPEGRQIFSKLTVKENLILGGYLVKEKKELKKRLERVYEQFPILKERQGQKAGKLSGGEQQMLAIGRALMSGAKLMLLDEPSLGLAPIVVKQVFKVIDDLNKQGVSILLVEQNVKEAMAISDRAYIMETGEIAMDGDSKVMAFDPRVKEIYLGGVS